jgi:hypothetical protein
LPVLAAQLLGELLLDRANVKVMMRYVSDVRNLQLMMILLKDSSRSIQFEAFHVFKARCCLIPKPPPQPHPCPRASHIIEKKKERKKGCRCPQPSNARPALAFMLPLMSCFNHLSAGLSHHTASAGIGRGFRPPLLAWEGLMSKRGA